RSGAIALASTNVRRNPAAATSQASFSAESGGQTLTITSHPAHNASSDTASYNPASDARFILAALRPWDAHHTSFEGDVAEIATTIPIWPGCRMPIRLMAVIV